MVNSDLSPITGLCLGLMMCFADLPLAQAAQHQPPPDMESQSLVSKAPRLEQEGKALFESGDFQGAVRAFQQAIAIYQSAEDPLGLAIAFSNLARVHGKLGQWPLANAAIATSLTTLQSSPGTQPQSPIVAQVLMVQGELQLAQGQSRAALSTWEQAESQFAAIGDLSGVHRSRLNQAQALQTLGFSRRAIAQLHPVRTALADQAPSRLLVLTLQSLGDTLRVTGELGEALEQLQQSLALAEQLQWPAGVAAAHLSLGNTQRALGNTQQAWVRYQQVVQAAGDRVTQTQAHLNQLSLALETQDWSRAQGLWQPLLTALENWVPSRQGIDARLNLAQSLIQLWQGPQASRPPVEAVTQLLSRTRQQARLLEDPVAESYALGILGALYEQVGPIPQAERLTQQALAIAQAQNAPEVFFRWRWQLGRILKAQNQRQSAVAAYAAAVRTLQSLRSDLIAVNPKVRFDFRDHVEPIHRQFVALLLDLESQQPHPANLETARLTIESLKLAELDNFFRQACLKANPVLIDQVDRQAAVIYPIILPQQLAVIMSLPGQPLRYYSVPVPQPQVERTVDRLRLALGQRNSPRYLPLAQQLYDWLLQSAASDLAQSQAKTLVFVLDGVLRNVPMAVLHDGEKYLVERYGVALTPGLELLAPQPFQAQHLNVLVLGVSESRQGFPPLPYVNAELAQIDAQVPSLMLQNQKFTQSAFQEAVDTQPFPVVHLATHGQFSSALDQTFLLTWEERLTVEQLRRLLRGSELRQGGAIELLVLSACETAAGDQRAALGLAGMAMRSGARSTLATLWQVNDQATALLMERFYRAWARGAVTKAEALRQAQQSMLQDFPARQHPYYWGAYVLVGNWL